MNETTFTLTFATIIGLVAVGTAAGIYLVRFLDFAARCSVSEVVRDWAILRLYRLEETVRVRASRAGWSQEQRMTMLQWDSIASEREQLLTKRELRWFNVLAFITGRKDPRRPGPR